MEISSAVLEHHFDESLLEQISSMRTVRLSLAESMLKDLDKTSRELRERGLLTEQDGIPSEELRRELTDRVMILRARMARPDVVYADEISLYVELLERQEANDGLHLVEN